MARAQNASSRRVSHFINGEVALGTGDSRGVVFDPSTGRQQAEVDMASGEDVLRAVATASRAFDMWRLVPLGRRAEIFFNFRELVRQRAAELSGTITSENGKVISDAAGEVARGLENIEFACGIPYLLKGDFSEYVSRGINVHSIRQPLGVTAGITPFNFPAMVPLWMLTTAIACGNTFVLKPSEKDPTASLLLAQWFAEAGLPDGVLNVINGERNTAELLISHPDVRAVSFVGSTPIARSVYSKATSYGKRVQALGGAKNHMVVLSDADLDVAVDAVIGAAYGSAGERCMAISVLVTVGDVAEPLIDAIKKAIAEIRIGPGADPHSEMGPLITREHRDRVASYLDIAKAEGAVVAVDGRRHECFSQDGFFMGASLLDHVNPTMKVYEDEIFGPILCVVRAATHEEAIEIVSENAFGNGCALYTRDGAAAQQFESQVDCGMVGINLPIPVPVASYSFGGWKSSLFGDTHMYGPEGIHFQTRTKVVSSRWPEPLSSQVDFGFSKAP